MNFFRFYPQVDYTFDVGGKVKLAITQLTAHAKLSAAVTEATRQYYDYLVQDGERPDSVATRLYGSPQYTWIILLYNNILTLFDWPLSTDEMTNYITEKYGSPEAAQSTFLYKTAQGYRVDEDTWNLLAPAQRQEPVSAYDHEYELNEQKRKIKVAPAALIPQLQQELKHLFA